MLHGVIICYSIFFHSFIHSCMRLFHVQSHSQIVTSMRRETVERVSKSILVVRQRVQAFHESAETTCAAMETDFERRQRDEEKAAAAAAAAAVAEGLAEVEGFEVRKAGTVEVAEGQRGNTPDAFGDGEMGAGRGEAEAASDGVEGQQRPAEAKKAEDKKSSRAKKAEGKKAAKRQKLEEEKRRLEVAIEEEKKLVAAAEAESTESKISSSSFTSSTFAASESSTTTMSSSFSTATTWQDHSISSSASFVTDRVEAVAAETRVVETSETLSTISSTVDEEAYSGSAESTVSAAPAPSDSSPTASTVQPLVDHLGNVHHAPTQVGSVSVESHRRVVRTIAASEDVIVKGDLKHPVEVTKSSLVSVIDLPSGRNYYLIVNLINEGIPTLRHIMIKH